MAITAAGVDPSQVHHLGGEPVPYPLQGILARLDQQRAVVAADVEPQEVEAIVEVRYARLVLVEGQAPGRQPRGEPRLDLLGLVTAVAERDQVVGVSDQDRRARLGLTGMSAGLPIADPGRPLHPMKGHVHQER
ncbi:hypothetical protein P3T34_007832 [Kitasatospora sp. MAP12-44]|nr:hypothetical protein [Kitasatospora sp. MAP12-44]